MSYHVFEYEFDGVWGVSQLAEVRDDLNEVVYAPRFPFRKLKCRIWMLLHRGGP